MNRRWPSFAALLLVAACAHPPERSAALGRAQVSSQRAAQAFVRGDLAAARDGYLTALRIHESLADSEGSARAMLNLARVTAQAGQAAEALAMVEGLLAESSQPSGQPSVQMTEPTLVLAHGRAAALNLTLGQAPAAERHLDEAARLCAGRCAEAVALAVLRVRTRLAQGQAGEALVLADAALALASGASAQARSETADVQRVRAQALAGLGRQREAVAAAESALQLDREGGRSEQVGLDLRLLAAAHLALGEADNARRYQALAERAQAARQALRGE